MCCPLLRFEFRIFLHVTLWFHEAWQQLQLCQPKHHEHFPMLPCPLKPLPNSHAMVRHAACHRLAAGRDACCRDFARAWPSKRIYVSDQLRDIHKHKNDIYIYNISSDPKIRHVDLPSNPSQYDQPVSKYDTYAATP